MFVCVFERERETSDEGEGDPAATFATGRVRYLGFSTIHIAGQLLVSNGGQFYFMLLVLCSSRCLNNFQIRVGVGLTFTPRERKYLKIHAWPTVVV